MGRKLIFFVSETLSEIWHFNCLYLSMETLVIKVPEKKSDLVKALLKELGVKIAAETNSKTHIPNELTIKTIKDARNGIDLGEPIKDVKAFMKSL